MSEWPELRAEDMGTGGLRVWIMSRRGENRIGRTRAPATAKELVTLYADLEQRLAQADDLVGGLRESLQMQAGGILALTAELESLKAEAALNAEKARLAENQADYLHLQETSDAGYKPFGLSLT